MLDIAEEPLSEEHIKKFHSLLKNNTSDSRKSWFNIGDYKSVANMVGGTETSLPHNVAADMELLLKKYHNSNQKTIEDIIVFSFEVERIHPFQDGMDELEDW